MLVNVGILHIECKYKYNLCLQCFASTKLALNYIKQGRYN